MTKNAKNYSQSGTKVWRCIEWLHLKLENWPLLVPEPKPIYVSLGNCTSFAFIYTPISIKSTKEPCISLKYTVSSSLQYLLQKVFNEQEKIKWQRPNYRPIIAGLSINRTIVWSRKLRASGFYSFVLQPHPEHSLLVYISVASATPRSQFTWVHCDLSCFSYSQSTVYLCTLWFKKYSGDNVSKKPR